MSILSNDNDELCKCNEDYESRLWDDVNMAILQSVGYDGDISWEVMAHTW